MQAARTFIHQNRFLNLKPFPAPSVGQRIQNRMTSSSGEVYFHKWKIEPSQIFFNSSYCYGLINLKPIVPGHVLLISKRVVSRLADLSSEEFADLFSSVHKIAPLIEAQYGATALNIAVQDGASAGQSVPHVHVHILPRKVKDFKHNDDVYDELDRYQGHDAVLGGVKQDGLATSIASGETPGAGGGSGSGSVSDDKGRGEEEGGVDFRRERQARSAEDMAGESEVLRAVLARHGVLSTPPY